MTDLQDLARAMAAADNQPGALHAALCDYADTLVGVRLFTLTMVDNARGVARRIFTNMPDAYPLLGTKPLKDDDWSHLVRRRHQTFVANDIPAIAAVFGDHELIDSLGCQSVINVPIVVAGRLLGTVNCLHQAGHYTPERVAASEALKLPGAVAFLVSAAETTTADISRGEP
jgi:GAF domain-containing protein